MVRDATADAAGPDAAGSGPDLGTRTVGTLRIIAGSLRGRRIRVPEGTVRPTRDRVREAVFNVLGQSAEDLDVLDLYAGSGALGLEAISRGARRAVFVEADARTANVLMRNLRDLDVESRAVLIRGSALTVLRSRRLQGFDLVFADPPYGDPEATGLLAALEESAVPRPGGVTVFEQDVGAPPPSLPRGWHLIREARYGRTVVRYYRRGTGPPAASTGTRG